MRVLLDENIPRRLKHRLSPEHIATTVVEHGWGRKRNGELLQARPRSNEYEVLVPLVPMMKRALKDAEKGSVTLVAA